MNFPEEGVWKMSEFENMKNILEATGLYRVDDDSIIAAELKAYAAALDLCFTELDELFREGFAASAESYGLHYWEKIMHHLVLSGNTQNRRNALLSAMSIGVNDYTLTGMQKVLDSFQVHGTLTYSDSEMKVTFRCSDALTETQKSLLQQQMAKMMPIWTAFEIVSES